MHQSQMKTNINIVYQQRRATQNIIVNQKKQSSKTECIKMYPNNVLTNYPIYNSKL